MINSKKLNQALQFIKEIDQLKNVLRQTLILDGSRQENSAEHSWQKHGVKRQQVDATNEGWASATPELGKYAMQLLDECEQKGFFSET